MSGTSNFMSFQVKCRRKIGMQLQDIAVEQMTKAIAELEGERPLSDAVHKVRQRTKKLRAVLQLMRGGIGRKAWKQENEWIREAARILGPMRDAEVLVETLDGLKERHFRKRKSMLLKHARQLFASEVRRLRMKLRDDGLVAEAIAALTLGRTRCCSWKLKEVGWKGVRKQFCKGLKRARAMARETVHDATPENLHEWRRRTKQLWYQAQLLREVWPHAFEVLGNELEFLARILGDDHDLAVLRSKLVERGEILRQRRQLDSLVKVIDEHRGELIEVALGMGWHIFEKRARKLHHKNLNAN